MLLFQLNKIDIQFNHVNRTLNVALTLYFIVVIVVIAYGLIILSEHDYVNYLAIN